MNSSSGPPKQERFLPPGEGIIFESHLGSFSAAVIKTAIEKGLTKGPDPGRSDNPFYFVYLSTPLADQDLWAGGIMIAGPYYPDTPEWIKIADLYVDLRLDEERAVRGPNHMLVVLRQLIPVDKPDTPDTALVWVPR